MLVEKHKKVIFVRNLNFSVKRKEIVVFHCSLLFCKGGGEPRMRSHYRGHKMALWLNLIPQLHQSGGPDVVMLHHNFREERPEFYEGKKIKKVGTYLCWYVQTSMLSWANVLIVTHLIT